ncbi:hypothetical protein [Chitiniphilus shinanonensis]|uniref:hypothetical protein n=1 Tax=Chitiniphilus shinanonensis TaxID=553088 RepID=UPI00302D7593
MSPIRAAIVDAPHAVAFAKSVRPTGTMISLPCDPAEGESQLDCFRIVTERVSAAGGRMVLGWAIWEWPGAFIEAEFHAVWENPAGDLIDIAPRPFEFSSIAFVPDSRLVDTGRLVDNIRQPLVDDKDVKQFLFLAKRRTEILNHPSIVELFGDIDLSLLPKALVKELRDQVKTLARLELRLMRRYPPK